MSKQDPNELIEVEFTGDHELELRDSEGSVTRRIAKGDKYTMKREQAEADANVRIPGKKDDAPPRMGSNAVPTG